MTKRKTMTRSEEVLAMRGATEAMANATADLRPLWMAVRSLEGVAKVVNDSTQYNALEVERLKSEIKSLEDHNLKISGALDLATKHNIQLMDENKKLRRGLADRPAEVQS